MDYDSSTVIIVQGQEVLLNTLDLPWIQQAYLAAKAVLHKVKK